MSTTSLVIELSLEPGSWTLLSPVHPLTAPHLREAYQRANFTIGAVFHMRCRRVGPGTRADLEGSVPGREAQEEHSEGGLRGLGNTLKSPERCQGLIQHLLWAARYLGKPRCAAAIPARTPEPMEIVCSDQGADVAQSRRARCPGLTASRWRSWA